MEKGEAVLNVIILKAKLPRIIQIGRQWLVLALYYTICTDTTTATCGVRSSTYFSVFK
jgi:hypothetical protein